MTEETLQRRRRCAEELRQKYLTKIETAARQRDTERVLKLADLLRDIDKTIKIIEWIST